VCANCGYSADVSGGDDYGGTSYVRTMSCADCKKLVDVVVGTDSHDEERRRRIGRCPRCGGKERLTVWGHVLAGCSGVGEGEGGVSGPCPRCEGEMRFGAAIGIWDA